MRQHVVSGLVILALLAGAALAQETKPALPGSKGADEVEELTDVAEVPAAATGLGGAIGVLPIIGRLHPSLVHLPIGWLLLLCLVDLAALGLKRPDLEKVGLYLLVGTVLCFIPGIVSGLLRAGELTGSGPTPPLMATHRNLILLMASLCVLALLLRLWRRNRLGGVWKWTYLALVLTAAGIVGVAGHLGGRMVFGENYLPL